MCGAFPRFSYMSACSQRSIVHLDADAFFASVEQAADARLRGKPIAVGGEKRGIIASASYEARQFGIYTPMPTAIARRLCPKLIILPGDFDKYELFSRLMFSYAYDFTPEVEIGSIDEGYFDLSGARGSVERGSVERGAWSLQPAVSIAERIRDAIRQSLKLSVSEGIGSNKLISQIASKLKKPAAFEFVPHGQEARFLSPLAAKWLPGVGPKTANQLNAAGLARIGQIALTPADLLGLLVGGLAPQLRSFALGIDERPIVPARAPAKSYSEQETFEADTTDEEFLEATLRRMADGLMAKVREDGKSIRTLAVKVRYNDMEEEQAGESLVEPTDLETEIYSRLSKLLRKAWKRRVSLRLVSLKFSNVYDGPFQRALALGWEMEEGSVERGAWRSDAPTLRGSEAPRRLAGVVDELRQKFGRAVLLRGHDFILRRNSKAEKRKSGKAERFHGISAFQHFSVSAFQQSYVPLNMHSYYSFLDSTLSPMAVVELARHHGLSAVALTDTGNLHGAVEFVQAARQAGVKPILGAEVRMGGAQGTARPTTLLLYVESAQGYHHLCRLLARHAELTARMEDGGRRAEGRAGRSPTSDLRPPGSSVAAQQRCPFRREEFDGLTDGLIAVSQDTGLAEMFPGRFYALTPALSHRMGEGEAGDTPAQFPVAACPAIHYATSGDRQKYDILQSIRTLTLLRQQHPEKRNGGRFHFRTSAEMAAACEEHPDWLRHTREIAERCNFDLPFGKPQFPPFRPPPWKMEDGRWKMEDGRGAWSVGASERRTIAPRFTLPRSTLHAPRSPREFLRRLVFQGLHERYGPRADQIRPQVLEELGIINRVGYEEYFLITWDFLQDCRRRGIEWITRGSAADSLVCYCLGISSVCPIRFDLYFRRFLNEERMALNKLPDIDIDFAHDLKDDVVKLIFEKYGGDHCAVVGGFSTFQARSAFAEAAKVLGVAEREVRKFTDHFPWSFGGGWVPDEPTPSGGEGLIELLRASPENRELPLDEEPYRTALQMAEFLDGMPRYPKMHPCGLVLSRQPMHELTPTFIANKGYATTHFDMDAVETIGLVKMDILAQGGLAAMRDVKTMLAERGIEVDLDRCVARDKSNGRLLLGDPQAPEPWGDPNVWEMIASGNARAVHHIESPAMTSLCRMCNVGEIDGLIAIVSVIRPGAANEGKKLAFTRRYQGLEPVTYPHPSLERCLRSTYGLVVYEEHILQLCEAFAGLPPGRADVLRRALNKQKRAVVGEIRGEFFASALARGHSPEKTAEVWKLVTGFAGYAFCKAHSTAYGVEAYQAAWLKRYFPAEFMAAVLTNGKGFYHPLVYVLECHRLGIPLLPPSVNQPGPAGVWSVERGAWSVERSDAPTLRRSDAPTRLRVPFLKVKGLTNRTKELILRERERGEFISLRDFYLRVQPLNEEMESLIRASAFDGFGKSRTTQYWEFKARPDSESGPLLPLENLDRLPSVPLTEPDRLQRLRWEEELLGYPVSGHPLELYPDIAWDTYCPINRLGDHLGQQIVTCGLVIEQRVHHQITGEPMKFLTIADWTGVVETELFAKTYKSYGLNTVRYRVLEITATVEPFENGRGFSLRVLRAGKPRDKTPSTSRRNIINCFTPPSVLQRSS